MRVSTIETLNITQAALSLKLRVVTKAQEVLYKCQYIFFNEIRVTISAES